MTKDNLISRGECLLVVIDVQERLFPVMAGKEKMKENIIRLLRFSRIIGLPVIVTEQEKLGPTIAEVRNEIQDFSPIKKITFDCLRDERFIRQLENSGKNTLILAGMESHICVAQTALHAVLDFRVHVASDAVSSRNEENMHVAFARMRSSGVTVTSTEMVIYELMEKAGTEEFRAVLRLVK